MTVNVDSPASEVPRLLGSYVPPSIVSCIWDVGSRDGAEAAALKVAYPHAIVHAFEPNPDTFPSVETVAAAYPGVHAHNLALSDTNGEIVFHKIDRQRTKTSWADGNPGASSLFQASGNYDGIEMYVQEAISVPSATAGELIDSHQLPPPDLVWMDVQGAELLVLGGFGRHISSVKAIYVELSLQEMYSGQALARDVLDFLAPGFYWVKVANPGSWQFDAVFVRKDLSGLGGRLRDLYFRAAMQVPGKPGVAAKLTRPRLAPALRSGTMRVADGLRSQRHPALKRSVMTIASTSSQVSSARLSYAARVFVEASLPSDPLAGETDLPVIDLVIACHSKDIGVLPLAMAGAHASSRNDIAKTLVIVPDSEPFRELQSGFGAQIINQRDVLPTGVFELVRRLVPSERQGWVIQQLVKLQAGLTSENVGSLVLDADTVLLRPRTFLGAQGRQLLSVSHEKHDPYLDHARRFWGLTSRPNISFVTHHQLMQRDVLQSMFGGDGTGLTDWVGAANWHHSSAVSEYHSYGAWLTTQDPSRALLGSWGNATISSRRLPDAVDEMSLTLKRLREDFPLAWSVSAHSYLA